MTMVDAGTQVISPPAAAPPAATSPDTPPTTPQAPTVNAAGVETHSVVVNGERRNMTLEELKGAASKVEAADEKFRRASDGVKVMDIYSKITDGTSTIDERRQYCDLFKLEGEDRESILTYNPNAEAPPEENPNTPPATPPAETPGAPAPQVRLEDLDPGLRNMLERANKTTAAKENQDFNFEATEQITKDEIATKMLTNIEPSRREGAESALLEMVRAEVVGRLQAGAKYGPVLLKDSVARVSSRAERLGVQTPRPDNPVPGLSPTDGGMASVLNSDQPIERISSTDSRWSENMAARVIKKAMSLGR